MHTNASPLDLVRHKGGVVHADASPLELVHDRVVLFAVAVQPPFSLGLREFYCSELLYVSDNPSGACED